MSRSRTAESGPPPAKRAKVDAKGGYKFTSADEIRRSFRNSDQDNLTQGVPQNFIIIAVQDTDWDAALTALRNQLTVRPDETVSPQDERVLLAQNWMDMAPGAHDLFEAWEGSNQVRDHHVLLCYMYLTHCASIETNVSFSSLCLCGCVPDQSAVVAPHLPRAWATYRGDTGLAPVDAPFDIKYRGLA